MTFYCMGLKGCSQGPSYRGPQSNGSVNIFNMKQKFYGNFVLIHWLENSKSTHDIHNDGNTFTRVMVGPFVKQIAQGYICLRTVF